MYVYSTSRWRYISYCVRENELRFESGLVRNHTQWSMRCFSERLVKEPQAYLLSHRFITGHV